MSKFRAFSQKLLTLHLPKAVFTAKIAFLGRLAGRTESLGAREAGLAWRRKWLIAKQGDDRLPWAAPRAWSAK